MDQHLFHFTAIYQTMQTTSVLCPLTGWNAKGFFRGPGSYRMVYGGQREPGETRRMLQAYFNIGHPEDFKGHSLFRSDG